MTQIFTMFAFPNNAGKLTIQKITSRINIRNVTNDVVYVKVYWCKARRDLDVGTANNNYSHPAYAWQYGFKDQQADATFTQYQQLGVTPYMAQSFCNKWKIIKSRRMVLGIGRAKSSKITRKNVIINKSMINASDVISYKNLTYAALVVVHGSMARDTKAAAPASVEGSTSPAEVIVHTQNTYKILDLYQTIDATPLVNHQLFASTANPKRLWHPIADGLSGVTAGTMT